MRRLARWTLNALTVLSPLLCVATCVLWSRSFSRAEGCGWQRGLANLHVTSLQGDFSVSGGCYRKSSDCMRVMGGSRTLR
jgi:hypothetical protein